MLTVPRGCPTRVPTGTYSHGEGEGMGKVGSATNCVGIIEGEGARGLNAGARNRGETAERGGQWRRGGPYG